MPAISPSPLLIYYILYTTDAALAAAWLAANPSGVVSAGPNHLAASAGLPVPNYTPTAIPDPSGCWFQYFPDGSYAHIGLLDKNADSGIIDPNDFYAIPTPPNTNWDPIQYIWQGSVFPFYTTATPPGGSTTLQPRYWACGFELGAAGNAALAQATGACCPAASRTTDGYGFSAQAGGGAGDLLQWTTTPPGSGTLPLGTWERIYIRPWVRPDQGEVAIWSCHDNVEGQDAAFLTMNTSGALVARNVGNAGAPGTVMGTSAPLPLNVWAKLDLLFSFATGQFALSINGVTAFSGSAGGSSGLGAPGARHQSSKVGGAQTFPIGGLTPTQYKYDLDDWIGINVPFSPSAPSTIDFTAGSHVRLANVNGISAAGAWTGDFRGLAGNPPGTDGVFNQMSANTPGTQLLLTTDFVNLPQLGVASVMVQSWPVTWPGSTVAKVGFRFNGGSLIQNTGTQVGAATNFCGQLFNLAPVRTDWTSVDISLDKDAGSSTVILAGMFASIEYVGLWGPEDVFPGTTPARTPIPRTGIHNAPYPEIAAAASPQNTMAWASARQGTYVGNGTGQDISVGVPFHWLWVRNLSTQQSEYWWSSHCAVHQGLDGRIAGPIDIGCPLPYPPSGDATSFHVSGNGANANTNGTTYQWVAFADPDSRFLINGAAAWDPSKFPSAVNTLQDPAFSPTCVFTTQEDIASSVAGFFYKGPGNPGDTASTFTGAADVSGVMTFAAGTITTKSAHSRGPQMAYGAWRPVDGTGASGVIDCVTYTGDGLASRNIAVNLGGNSPLFAMGIAHTAASYYRDPSHTSLNSTQFGSGLSTTALIGGGINVVTVGASLNVAGRVYDLFVIAGSPYAGTWTPPVDPGTGVPPVPPPVPPVTPPPGPPPVPVPPPVVIPVHGWWRSDAGFRGNVEAFGDSRPANPRSWKDFVGFATGSAAMLGGTIAAVYRNRLVYAASGYVVGTAAPPIRIFDGSYDRELTTIPPTSAGPSHGVVALLVANGTIYVATWDTGTSPSTWVGRVFSLDLDSATLAPIGGVFPTGHLPYALTWLNSQLWCGTQRQDGSAGKVFAIRPGDAAWTADHDVGAAGSVAALAAFHGSLFVGTTAVAGTFGQVLKRAADGTYSSVDIGTLGTAKANNGYLSFAVFNDALYAGYWNNDTTPIALVRRSADGVAWTTAFAGASGTLRPFIALAVDAKTLYAVGGGLGLKAAVVASDDGAAWTDLTPQLPAAATNTAVPAVGTVVL